MKRSAKMSPHYKASLHSLVRDTCTVYSQLVLEHVVSSVSSNTIDNDHDCGRESEIFPKFIPIFPEIWRKKFSECFTLG